ncbi:MAG: hypothetical protein A2X22_05650 [Bacteroidetes bacterium GWF2_49_14]|nr:MAG: hypothetical protein A2X22_05650 [Bacteroidetes bacterium GWF2_49_14]HBB90553.1 hypothetical protein [Bacteroidales bacterium]
MRYRIGFIGAGKVAWHLAPALAKSGQEIIQVISRSALSAQKLGDRLSCQHSNNITDLIKDAEILFLTVPDHSLIEIINDISDYRGLVIHTSGTFSPLRFACQKYKHGGLYPLQTFTIGRTIDMSTVPVFVEGSEPAVARMIQGIAEGFTSKVYEMSFEERRWMHLAAVWANNFSNFMLTEAYRILKLRGQDPVWLEPLIRETFDKALVITPGRAQTGPAIRNDDITIRKHLDMLTDQPDMQELYRMITHSIRESETKTNIPGT